MSKHNDKSDGVLYLRKFPRELKRRLRIAAIAAGEDLQDYVVPIFEKHLSAVEKAAGWSPKGRP